MGTSLSFYARIWDPFWVWLTFWSVGAGRRKVCPWNACAAPAELSNNEPQIRGVVCVLPSWPTSCIYSEDCYTGIKFLTIRTWLRLGNAFLWVAVFEDEYMTGYMWKLVFCSELGMVSIAGISLLLATWSGLPGCRYLWAGRLQSWCLGFLCFMFCQLHIWLTQA